MKKDPKEGRTFGSVEALVAAIGPGSFQVGVSINRHGCYLDFFNARHIFEARLRVKRRRRS